MVLFAQNPATTLINCQAEAGVEKDTICHGESVKLMAINEADQYSWTSLTTLTGDTTRNPTVSPDFDMTYFLSARSFGSELLQNGDFEDGLGGFSSDYNLGLGGNMGFLSEQGTYGISVNPATLHQDYAACTDHSDGTGRMLIVNGNTIDNEKIWCQTIEVETGTDYQLSFWASALTPFNPAVLQFSVNDESLEQVFTVAPAICSWSNFKELWKSGDQTQAEICIVNKNTGQGGNDFALDDISLKPICISHDSVSVVVSNPYAAINNVRDVGCDGTLGSAFVNASGGIGPYNFSWLDQQNTQTANDLEEGIVAVTITDAFGCTNTAAAQIGLATTPIIDTAIIDQPFCYDELGRIQLQMAGLEDAFSFSLDGGPFLSDGNTAFLFEDIVPGQHQIISKASNGCELSYNFTIEASDRGFVEIETLEGEKLCNNESLTLDAGNFESYFWSTGDTQASIEISEVGTYSVDVLDAEGCMGTAEIKIERCESWAMPNAFTPDGDGENDTFGPIFVGDLNILNFQIYNSWGKLVHDQPRPWDGTFNGKSHPSGVLIYSIQFYLPNQSPIQLKGQVTLVR